MQAGSQVGSVDLQPLPGSRYGFKVLCPSAGATQLNFSFGGAALFEGPVALSVQPAPVDVRSCVAEFVGKKKTFEAGAPISVKVTLCDALRNAIAITEQHKVQVYLAPGKSESVILDNISAGWKSFDVNGDVAHVTVDKAGSYIVHVTVDGGSLPHWPRTITVNAGAPDAKHCSVVLPASARWSIVSILVIAAATVAMSVQAPQRVEGALEPIIGASKASMVTSTCQNAVSNVAWFLGSMWDAWTGNDDRDNVFGGSH